MAEVGDVRVGAAAKARDKAWLGGQVGVHVLLSFAAGAGGAFLAFREAPVA